MAKPFRKWYVVHIDVPADSKGIMAQELIVNRCFELGSTGTERKDYTILAYYESKLWNQTIYEKIQKYCRELVKSGSLLFLPRIRLDRIDEEDWKNNWKDHFKPVEIGRSLVIVPPWEEKSPAVLRPGAVMIVIEPGMAFGTGGHESTELALALIEEYCSEGMKGLDIGTGSGILAVAMAKCGAANVAAIDIDSESIEAARKNVERNDVGGVVSVEHQTIQSAQFEDLDIAVANLNRTLIIENSKKIAAMFPAERQGIFIASGLTKDDTDTVTETFSSLRFDLLKRIVKNDWAALAFQSIIL